jgi:hypothetical protein
MPAVFARESVDEAWRKVWLQDDGTDLINFYLYALKDQQGRGVCCGKMTACVGTRIRRQLFLKPVPRTGFKIGWPANGTPSTGN